MSAENESMTHGRSGGEHARPQDLDVTEGFLAKSTQRLARSTLSRRGALAVIGRFLLTLAGAELIRVLPVDREVFVVEAAPEQAAPDCNAWYMCGAYADRLCSCACGSNSCPSGTTAAGFWQACCWSGSKWLIVRYYDCCTLGSKPACCNVSGCECHRGSPGIWCGGWPGWSLCCTRWQVQTVC